MNMLAKEQKSSTFLKTLVIVLVTAVISVGVTIWVLTNYVFPSNFTPVTLSAQEQTELDSKLAVLETGGWSSPTQGGNDMQPEKYTEKDADRVISLSERELNGMIANNSDIAHRLVIDLSDDLASAKLLVPLDPEFPVMGGRNLRLSAGLELAYANGKPVVVLRGVSVMGVPVPGAWLGGLKNVELVNEFGGRDGFWQAFADGVDFIRVEQGRLLIKLKA